MDAASRAFPRSTSPVRARACAPARVSTPLTHSFIPSADAFENSTTGGEGEEPSKKIFCTFVYEDVDTVYTYKMDDDLKKFTGRRRRQRTSSSPKDVVAKGARSRLRPSARPSRD